jgi:site-specific DNA recombinase
VKQPLLLPGSIVYGYLRASPGPQQEKSTADQRKELAAYAEARGWIVAHWFEDDDRSGTNVERRPAFLTMVAECHRKPAPVTAVIVWSLSRFGRDQREAAYYTADLELHGVQLVSLTEDIPEEFSEVYRSLIRWKDSQYISDLRESVKRGQRQNLARGLMRGGHVPTGYKAEHVQAGRHRDGSPRMVARWVPDPDVAPLVRQAFEMRASGQPLTAILAATRIVSSRQAVQVILHNPLYRGVLRYGGAEYPDIVEPLVDAATWEAAQRRETMHPRRAGGDYLLSGLLRCGWCGSAMTGSSSPDAKRPGHRYRYYVCSKEPSISHGECAYRRTRAELLDGAVMRIVLEHLQPAAFEQMLAEARAGLADDDTGRQLERIAGEIDAATRARDNLLDLAERNVLSIEEISRRLREREAELAQLEAQRAAIARPPAILTATPEAVGAKLAQWRDNLAAGDIHTQRHVLRELIASLTYGPELRVEFRVPQ